MSQCRQAGDWRAYVDGELAAEEMARGSEHLAQCAECAALHREIAGRAARVSAMLGELGAVPVFAAAPPVVAARSRRRWVGAGIGLAAAMAAMLVLAPKRSEVADRPQQVAVMPPAPVETAVPAVPVLVKRRIPARARRRAAPQYFLAFDDEPIDTGTVMRVALDGGVEADLIVDASGRPRAIRPIQ